MTAMVSETNQSVRLPGKIWVAGDGPFAPAAVYTQMVHRWKLPRTLYDGTVAMRRAGQTYLPAEPGEKDADYSARLARSTLYNIFRQTVETMTGKIFSQPVTFAEKTNPRVKDLESDVDRRGTALHPFLKMVMADAMIHGKSHILVDMPPIDGPRTLADERAQGIRPYWVHVPATDVIGWKTAVINGVETLTQVRILQYVCEDDPENEFAAIESQKVLVYERDRWRLYKIAGDKAVLEKAGINTLGRVPLVTVNLQRANDLVSDPPIEDLAQLNLQHWQSASDQRNILHWVRVPVLFGSGFPEGSDTDGNERLFGPMNMIIAPENAKLSWVEHSGKAIESGRNDLIDLEERMRVAGLDLLRPRGTRTATEKSIDTESVNSPLQTWAYALKDSIELAIELTCEWMKTPYGESGAVVNTSFDLTLHSDQTLQTLEQMRARGDISHETYLNEIKRNRVVAEDFDIMAEVEKVKTEKADAQAQAMETMKAQAEIAAANKPEPNGKPAASKPPAPPSGA